jgi:hypothetical protein
MGCRLIRTPTRKKMYFYFNMRSCNSQICYANNPTIGNIISYSHCKGHFISLTSTLKCWNNKNDQLTYFCIRSLAQFPILNMSKLHSTSISIWVDYESRAPKWSASVHNTSTTLGSMTSNHIHLQSNVGIIQMNEDTRHRFLYHTSNKDITCCDFF